MKQTLDADKADLKDIVMKLYIDATKLDLSIMNMIYFINSYDILWYN